MLVWWYIFVVRLRAKIAHSVIELGFLRPTRRPYSHHFSLASSVILLLPKEPKGVHKRRRLVFFKIKKKR